MLTNVIAFDVRVFDPAAPVAASPSGGTPLVAGDSGFANSPVASGGYVDLGQGILSSATTNSLLAISTGTIFPHFAAYGQGILAGSATTRRTYDTWSTHYEANGRDEDGDGVTDDGTNGLDDNGDDKIDEPPYDSNGDGDYVDAGENAGELETAPPYAWPLRGIEIRIRCYEPSSRQVRQVTIRHTFVPL